MIEFLPTGSEPTDTQLLLQLVWGLCDQIRRPGEEKCDSFWTAVQIPKTQIRRLAKLLVKKMNLPIPECRVDEFIERSCGSYEKSHEELMQILSPKDLADRARSKYSTIDE